MKRVIRAPVLQYMIYFDYFTTFPTAEYVLQAMVPWMALGANASSVHRLGCRAASVIDQCIAVVQQELCAPATSVIFTGQAAETNLLGIAGIARTLWHQAGRVPQTVLLGPIQHPDMQTAAACLRQYFVGTNLCVALLTDVAAQLPAACSNHDVILLGMALQHPETGLLQPMALIQHITKQHGVALHIDATTVLGRMPVDFAALGCISLALCGSSMGGPCGIGVLVVQRQHLPQPLWAGGQQQQGIRPGTPAVALIAGFMAAMQNLSCTIKQVEDMAVVRDSAEAMLAALPYTSLVWNTTRRLPNVLHFTVQGARANAIAAALKQRNIMVATTPESTNNVVRVCCGLNTTQEDMLMMYDALKAILDQKA